ncbi:sterol desaturase/sphingolipid hydroxylase (fatty acid hydroxylase superfamily) [Actinophytocola algeriensis]|uniref:Sterol desaturase/sphingolipid hydroxylase (Fatty acid hydroxylase superfamily) n=2 Tax=Actinophytocola algeriensis TaxID=1768010 RepID=A0A7W7Q2D5_9PSEU|nr:sterol desaturase/sphingolipid hydroxylase (fatty acid hydroxylase superfamily) [Actinophytocola algeriensis]MBE1472623.1 sterol desaturase/sphingolipid hydroxylase (fatty acid hydroxylase superfamily) [Actinophytocola algeriensis]
MTDMDRLAKQRLAADEAALTAAKRRPVGIGDAARAFWRHPSPWLIATLLVCAATARGLVGDWRLSDLWTPLVMLAVFPFFEWAVHVCVLHWRPRHVGRITIDPLLSRKHRAHHVDPRDTPLVFIPWQVQLWLVPLIAAIGLLAFPRAGLGLTFMTVVGLLGLGYEWTHYLIHSDYRPKSRVYRAIWRNHRLHHYKNEHYWFTVTSSGTADRVLGTYPDATTVTTSPTVRDLHAREAGA